MGLRKYGRPRAHGRTPAPSRPRGRRRAGSWGVCPRGGVAAAGRLHRSALAGTQDAAFLASLVVGHQLSEEDAFGIALRLVGEIPRTTFRLG